MTHTRQKGRDGEDLAAIFLTNKGYHILERNWYFGRKEIDLIAVDGDELVICEVKSRVAPMLETPEQAIGKIKQRSLVFAAHAYARYHKIDLEVRFDVLFVIRFGAESRIEHIRRAFYPSL